MRWRSASTHMLENAGAAAVRFAATELAELDGAVRAIEVRGARLPDVVQAFPGVEAPPASAPRHPADPAAPAVGERDRRAVRSPRTGEEALDLVADQGVYCRRFIRVDQRGCGGYVTSSVRIRVLALLLLLSIVPSTMELVEAVVHWVEHGDSAHGDGHGSAALGTDEHGCSGTFHLCGQRAAGVMAPRFVVELSIDSCADQGACVEPAFRVGLGATAPPVRPPIA